MKNIIHLSDMHLSNHAKYGFKYSECINVVSALIEDIKLQERNYNIKFDTIFFTGDLTFSGDKKEFELFNEHVRLRLLNELSVVQNDFHILPGNHDICRGDIGFLEKNMRANDDALVNKLFDAVNRGDEQWKRLDNYFEYEKLLGAQNYDEFTFLTKIKKVNKNLYLMFVNSAWLCMDENDKGNIYITSKQIEYCLSKIPSTAKVILLTHHPLDWLNQDDRVKFSSFIEKRVGMMFFGHMHEFKQIKESNFNEDITIFLQAGTLDAREDFSGYSCVILNNENEITDGKVIYRKFNKSQLKYSAWQDYGDQGVFDFSTVNSLTFDSDKFIEISERILAKVDKDHLINIGYSEDKKKSLRKFFSEPNFHPVETMPHLEQKITYTEQINSVKENLIVVGGAYSGKTSVLKFLFAKSLEKQINRDFSRFSFYYDCKETVPTTKNKFFQNIISQYFATELNTSFEEKIKRMLENGYSIIYIDNIDFPLIEKNSGVFDFISAFPKCKYVFSVDQVNIHELEEKLVKSGLSGHLFTSLGQIKRKNVRDIVSKWDETYVNKYQNILFRELNKLVDNSQLPHNYFIYSMLLAIYELKSEIQGILTEADIIENFIEILLKKHCVTKDKTQPQFKELMHFMGFLAKHFYDTQSSFLSRNQMVKVALEYNERTLYSFDVDGYIEPLIQSGLLKKDGAEYYFSQPCFVYYSLAYFMDHDDKLKNEILDQNVLISHDKVIEYFTARNASKFDTIDIIQARIINKRKEISALVSKYHNVDMDSINDFDINDTPILNSLTENVEEFIKEIEKVKADRDEVDNRMDEISPLESRNESHKKVFSSRKEKATDNKLKEFIQLLSLYSRVFRNIELSMDKDRLMTIFNEIIHNYMFVMKAFIITTDGNVIIPILEKKLSEVLEERGVFNEDDVKEFILTVKAILPIVRSGVPNYVQNLMSQDLMSKKTRMENIFKTSLNDSNEDLVNALLHYSLIDSNDSNIRRSVNEMLKMKNNLVSDSLFLKLNMMINTYYHLGDDDIRFLKGAIQRLVSKGKVHINPSAIKAMAKLE